MRLMNEREGEDLRRLHSPQLRAVEGEADLSFLHLLDGILDGDGGDGGLMFPRRLQARLQNFRRDKGTRAIVDHHPLCFRRDLRQFIEAQAHRILTAWATGDDGGDFAPPFALAQRVSLVDALCTEDEDDAIDAGKGFKDIDGAGEDWASGQRHPELIAPLHAPATPGGDDYGGCPVTRGVMAAFFHAGCNLNIAFVWPMIAQMESCCYSPASGGRRSCARRRFAARG